MDASWLSALVALAALLVAIVRYVSRALFQIVQCIIKPQNTT